MQEPNRAHEEPCAKRPSLRARVPVVCMKRPTFCPLLGLTCPPPGLFVFARPDPRDAVPSPASEVRGRQRTRGSPGALADGVSAAVGDDAIPSRDLLRGLLPVRLAAARARACRRLAAGDRRQRRGLVPTAGGSVEASGACQHVGAQPVRRRLCARLVRRRSQRPIAHSRAGRTRAA